jgi:CRISPR-associated protein Cmr2
VLSVRFPRIVPLPDDWNAPVHPTPQAVNRKVSPCCVTCDCVNQPGAAWKQIEDKWQLASLAESFEQPQLSLAELPPLSFRLSFKFTLAKPVSLGETRPFFSRDEEALYVIDNPVRKDKTLRLPFLAPASYKGLLRSAARLVIGDPLPIERDPKNPVLDNARIERLFGTDRREQTKDLRQGRLWCFPTFFREVGLKIINPHLRDTGAGDKPILFETATGAGNFHLLYLPFDLTPTSFQEVAADLQNVARTIKELFTAHGLGAKTSSGFGLAEDKLVAKGTIEIKAAGLPPQQAPAEPAAPQTSLVGYLKAPGQLKDEFANEVGELITEDEYKKRVAQRGHPYTKNRGWDYDKARKWWEREGKNLTLPEPVLATPGAKPSVAEWTFESFSGLVKVADKLATALEQLAGGGQ